MAARLPRWIRCAMVMLAFLLVATAHGTIPGESGRGSQYWKQTSVILGYIDTITRQDNGDFLISVRTHSTLSGSMDAGLLPKFSADLTTSRLSSRSRYVPKVGERIMAVIRRDQDGFFVSSNAVDYMPAGAGLVGLQSFDDQTVTDVLEQIQAIRKNEEREKKEREQE